MKKVIVASKKSHEVEMDKVPDLWHIAQAAGNGKCPSAKDNKRDVMRTWHYASILHDRLIEADERDPQLFAQLFGDVIIVVDE